MTFRAIDKNHCGYITTAQGTVDAISEAVVNTVESLSLLRDAKPGRATEPTIVANVESMEPSELRRRADLLSQTAARNRQKASNSRQKETALAAAIQSPDFKAAVKAARQWLTDDAEQRDLEADQHATYAATLRKLADEIDARRKAATLEGRVESLEAELKRLQDANAK